jgi:hypothetical protein
MLERILGFSRPITPAPPGERGPTLVVRESKLRRILAFTSHSIDDIINDPIARGRVQYYFKCERAIQRGSEIVELERQWNPLGR